VVARSRGGELRLGLGPGTLRAGCGDHGQCNSTLQFQQWFAHGQLSGLATRGQPGALQAGLGHRDGSPLATSGASGRANRWLPRLEETRF
jgi:hypothetical protein